LIWIIASVILGLIMMFFMSRRTEEDDDPVWMTVQAVDRLGDEIRRWENNLHSLWAMALVENLLFRMDVSERGVYLNKLEDQISELQQELYKSEPMSEKDSLFPYFETKTTDLQNH